MSELLKKIKLGKSSNPKKRKNGIKCDIMLATYDLTIRDTQLADIDWYYIVVDEAHRLKNSSSRLVAALNECTSQYR